MPSQENSDQRERDMLVTEPVQRRRGFSATWTPIEQSSFIVESYLDAGRPGMS